jgi:aspartate aminotransferase-like enzyme
MSEKFLLMSPGPTEVDPRVIRAMLRPAIHHYDSQFIDIYDETEELLRKIFQTNNDIITFPGSGRSGIESSVLTFIDPGEKVLAITTGTFGNWFIEILRIHGANLNILSYPQGKHFECKEIKHILEEDKNISSIAIVHNETSTGAIYSEEVKQIGYLTKDYDKFFLVDAISSMGGANVPVDEWNIDVCITSSQKALGGLLGLSIVSVSEKAWQKAIKRPSLRSFSYDLIKWKKTWIKKERGGLLLKGRRSFPVLPPTHLIYALNEATKIILEEGLENRFKRHEEVAKEMRNAIKNLGLEIYPEESVASPTVTAFKVPIGLIGKQIRQKLRDEHNIIVAGGMDELSEKIIRIGHMGYTANINFIKRTAIALENVLYKLNYKKV